MAARFPSRLTLASATLVALASLALSGCSGPAPEPTTETGVEEVASGWPRDLAMFDNAGEPVTQTLKAEPQRVVVVGQNLAELMVAFDVEDKIVGVGYLDGADSYYEEQLETLPKLSDQVPSVESVMALNPDVILSMSFAMTEENLGTIETWNERGVQVITADNYTIGRDLDTYYDDIRNIGLAFNVTEQTDAYIADEQKTLDAITKVSEGAETTPQVLLVASGGANKLTYNYYSPSLGLVDEMVEAAGGEYVEVSKETYAEMSAETIIKANPDVIVMTQFQKGSSEEEREALVTDERLAGVTAIAEDRVYLLDYATSVRGTPHLGELTLSLAEQLHPELNYR
ncbi:ABC transporter substrate-binding protein [Leucobacter chinensis]|uniref:ABC transporter substrate-binding protein n=1 Tax=Leucobacter chinensis TaxID=2851010 RepID=UPI001C21F150|nr:ABC transporter substrate-binding protein [Leucobacter chinensis]